MKDYIGKPVRQKRPKDKNGNCRDTARVTVIRDGIKKYYSIGRWGSPETEKAYKKLLADFYSDSLEINQDTTYFVMFLTHYWEHAEPLKSDPGRFRTKKVLRIAKDTLGATLCSKFNFSSITVLKEHIVQEAMKYNWTKAYANQLLSVWKRVLIYGVLNGWLDSSLLPLIKAYPAITDNLRTLQNREGVDDSVVNRTLKYMPQKYADMLRLIRSACLRPTELFRLKKSNIQIKEGQWVAYIPSKTERFGYSRIIVFTDKEIEILQRWITDDEMIFKCTSRYLNAIVNKAIKKANENGETIPKWTPYQLRHSAFTENVKKYGVEIAAKLAGHSSLNMARIYDHSTEAILRELAKQR